MTVQLWLCRNCWFKFSDPKDVEKSKEALNRLGQEETRGLEYEDNGGYVYEENARYWLGKVNEQLPEGVRIYFHYGRHSIGIKMAYQGRTPYQIAEVLDETVQSALEYMKHAGGYAQEWTKETE